MNGARAQEDDSRIQDLPTAFVNVAVIQPVVSLTMVAIPRDLNRGAKPQTRRQKCCGALFEIMNLSDQEVWESIQPGVREKP
jgi:hypothetical protein